MDGTKLSPVYGDREWVRGGREGVANLAGTLVKNLIDSHIWKKLKFDNVISTFVQSKDLIQCFIDKLPCFSWHFISRSVAYMEPHSVVRHANSHGVLDLSTREKNDLFH